MTKVEFIKECAKYAVPIFNKVNILPSVAIAQAILESGWGEASKLVPYNNYHGLNYYDDEVTAIYDHVSMNCYQERDGKLIPGVEEFCKFDSMEQSFECLARWYTMREKYNPIIMETDYITVCNFLTGKYATDSHYGEKLIKIINDYNLKYFDIRPYLAKYYVVAGSFENLDNALLHQGHLARLGYRSILKVKGGQIRVQVGAFEFREKADSFADKLENEGVDCYIETCMAGWIEV